MEAGGSSNALCPRCGVVSRSNHSCYWRRLKDLPLQGASVTIKLHLGRWRCRNRKCERKIFTERVPGVLVPHAQRTIRLGEVRMLVGRALGGRPGQRLMSRLGMAVSRHTLLRQVTRVARDCVLADVIRVVGVDDCCSKGQSYGTILVDLECSAVADLLATRSADALCEWLTTHPEVIVVTRDRHGIYAEGARLSAPEAVQVADRFHLTLNLRQAVERELAVKRRHLRVTPPRIPTLPPAPRMEAAKSQSREV